MLPDTTAKWSIHLPITGFFPTKFLVAVTVTLPFATYIAQSNDSRVKSLWRTMHVEDQGYMHVQI